MNKSASAVLIAAGLSASANAFAAACGAGLHQSATDLFRFNGGQDNYFASGGTASVASPVFSPGKVGDALNVAGDLTHVVNVAGPAPSSFTYVFWVRQDSPLVNNPYLLDYSPGGQPNTTVSINSGSGKFEVAVPGATLTSSTDFAAATWFSVAVSYNHLTGTFKLYINGVLEDSETVSPASVSGPSLYYIGGDDSLTAGLTFDGLIDEFHAFNSDLVAAHIDAIFDADSNATCDQTPTQNKADFGTVANAEPGMPYTSSTLTIGGLDNTGFEAPFSIRGGEYSLNGGAFTSSNGFATNSDTLVLRLTTEAGEYRKLNRATVSFGAPLTVGTLSYDVTTRKADTTPNTFNFASVYNAQRNTTYTSNAITVSGLEIAAPISISGAGGQYEKNNSGVWTSSAGTVTNGDTVKVRLTSSAAAKKQVVTKLNIGGVTDNYDVTTK